MIRRLATGGILRRPTQEIPSGPVADFRAALLSRVIAEFESADTGLVVINGKLIEKPVLRDMHRIVAIADRMKL